jgi:hypothetical protein
MNPYSPPVLDVLGSSPRSPDPPYRGTVPTLATDLTIEHLRRTRPWVILISVVTFLASGLMLMGGLAVGARGALGASGSKFPAWVGLVYLPFGLVYVFPAVKLWTYANAIGRLLVSRGTGDLESALDQQRSFWKFCGIAFIVVVALYAAVFVGAMVFAMTSRL